MSKYLVVIESPGKLKSYQKYLGPEYEICASYGHIADLPKKGSLGVDLKNNFEASFSVTDDKTDVVRSIVSKAKKAKLTYLMTDPDREGEGISFLLSQQFPKDVKYKRAATASITKAAIQEAMNNAGDIDLRMVDSFLTRRILDRIVGWKTSFLTKQATGGASAGRVQSAALRLLADREREIRNFVPVEYWPVGVDLLTKDKKKIEASVVVPDKMEIKSEVMAKEVEAEIRDYMVKVATYDTQTKSNNPYPPFITTTLQGAASNMFGWDQKRTMGVAQKLYEGGHITYMRTDSSHIVPEAVSSIRDAALSKYGDKYVPSKPNYYKGGKNAQEAHEAIRPTHIEATSVSTGDEQKLYQLIWKRTVASQMTAEVRELVRATFSNGRGKVVMAASGSRQVFDGWKRCMGTESDDTYLPEMKVGDVVDVKGVSYEQKFTEPPSRFGVATFNAQLEKAGIGRPATYAAITETLKARGYIETVGKSHHVTDLGLRVVDFLVGADFCFVDTGFTRDMEDKLDDILNEKTDKVTVLTAFWERLQKDIKNANSTRAEANVTTFPCPTCKAAGREKFLVKKFSKFGPFYSCEARSDKAVKCEYTAIVGENDEPITKVKKVLNESEHTCAACGKKLIIRDGKFGPYLGCRNWTDPKCRGFYQMDGTKNAPSTGKKKFWRRKK